MPDDQNLKMEVTIIIKSDHKIHKMSQITFANTISEDLKDVHNFWSNQLKPTYNTPK